MALGATLLSALFVLVVMGQITYPLRQLARAADQVRGSDVAHTPDAASFPHQDRHDETGHLETVLLRGERLSNAERERFLQVALKNAQHRDRLSASLFDFARLDSDAVRLEKVPAHIGELLDDIAQHFAPVAEVRGVTIHCHTAATLPMIEIDAALTERTLANLVENALRYAPQARCDRIGCRAVWRRYHTHGQRHRLRHRKRRSGACV